MLRPWVYRNIEQTRSMRWVKLCQDHIKREVTLTIYNFIRLFYHSFEQLLSSWFCFVLFAYYISEFNLYCTFFTEVLAKYRNYREKNPQISKHPVGLYIGSAQRAGNQNWSCFRCRTLTYCLPSLVFSVLLNLPRFWETYIKCQVKMSMNTSSPLSFVLCSF